MSVQNVGKQSRCEKNQKLSAPRGLWLVKNNERRNTKLTLTFDIVDTDLSLTFYWLCHTRHVCVFFNQMLIFIIWVLYYDYD